MEKKHRHETFNKSHEVEQYDGRVKKEISIKQWMKTHKNVIKYNEKGI